MHTFKCVILDSLLLFSSGETARRWETAWINSTTRYRPTEEDQKNTQQQLESLASIIHRHLRKNTLIIQENNEEPEKLFHPSVRKLHISATQRSLKGLLSCIIYLLLLFILETDYKKMLFQKNLAFAVAPLRNNVFACKMIKTMSCSLLLYDKNKTTKEN